MDCRRFLLTSPAGALAAPLAAEAQQAGKVYRFGYLGRPVNPRTLRHFARAGRRRFREALVIGAVRARESLEHPQRLLLVATVGLVLTGCVTLTPQQKDTIAEVQGFADATTAHYEVPRVRIVVEPATNLGIGARYRLAHLYLNVRVLGSRGLTAIAAHELAHYVLGHDIPMAGASMGEFQRAQELRELDANAKAVEILMLVKGLTEREAVQTMVNHLTGAQRAEDRGGARAWGHRAPTQEIADLLQRFPKFIPPQVGGEPVPLDSVDPRYSAYLGRVREMIKQKWSYPCVTNEATATCEYKSAKVVIVFDVLSDGRVTLVAVQERSGHEIYDDYAVNAITQASPFPPVPPELMTLAKSGGTGIRITAAFDYNATVQRPNE